MKLAEALDDVWRQVALRNIAHLAAGDVPNPVDFLEK